MPWPREKGPGLRGTLPRGSPLACREGHGLLPAPPCVPRAGDGTPGSLQLQVWSVDQQLRVTGELARKDKCQPPPAPRSSAQGLDNVWTVWHLKMSSRGNDVIPLLQHRGFQRTRTQAGYGDAEGGKATVRVLVNRTRPLPREGSWVHWLIPVTSTSLRPRCLPLLPAVLSLLPPPHQTAAHGVAGRQRSPGSLPGKKIHGPSSRPMRQNLRVWGPGTWVLTRFPGDS